MARVTVEDCLEQVPNRFALTVLASRRARALSEKRGVALVECDNKEGVTALREIAGAQVRYEEDVEETIRGFIEEQRSELRITSADSTFLEAASFGGVDGDEDGDDEDDVQELSSDSENIAEGADDDDDDDDGDGDGDSNSGEEALPEGTELAEDGDDADVSDDDDAP